MDADNYSPTCIRLEARAKTKFGVLIQRSAGTQEAQKAQKKRFSFAPFVLLVFLLIAE